MNHYILNLKAYSSKRMVTATAAEQKLQPPEEVIFSRLSPHVAGGAILDIGVGCGRTTPALTEISQNYTGIDYSDSMIDACKRRLPGQRFMRMDARTLDEAFPPDHFDLIVFAFNGIDSVGHEDRLTILSKVHRVLKPGGRFVFSSHNRNFVLFERFLEGRPRIVLTRNPIYAVRNVLIFPIQYARYAKNSQHNITTDEYAVVNEPAADYSMLQYYISGESQIRQLLAVGFDPHVEAYDLKGSSIDCGRDVARDSAWIYYIATKNQPSAPRAVR